MTPSCTPTCSPSCTSAYSPSCTPACSPSCTPACSPSLTPSCTPSCRSSCTSGCTSSSTLNCTHSCIPSCTPSCTPSCSPLSNRYHHQTSLVSVPAHMPSPSGLSGMTCCSILSKQKLWSWTLVTKLRKLDQSDVIFLCPESVFRSFTNTEYSVLHWTAISHSMNTLLVVVRPCDCHIRTLLHVCIFIDQATADTTACFFVSTLLDYCNSMFCSVERNNRIQHVQVQLVCVVWTSSFKSQKGGLRRTSSLVADQRAPKQGTYFILFYIYIYIYIVLFCFCFSYFYNRLSKQSVLPIVAMLP